MYTQIWAQAGSTVNNFTIGLLKVQILIQNILQRQYCYSKFWAVMCNEITILKISVWNKRGNTNWGANFLKSQSVVNISFIFHIVLSVPGIATHLGLVLGTRHMFLNEAACPKKCLLQKWSISIQKSNSVIQF